MVSTLKYLQFTSLNYVHKFITAILESTSANKTLVKTLENIWIRAQKENKNSPKNLWKFLYHTLYTTLYTTLAFLKDFKISFHGKVLCRFIKTFLYNHSLSRNILGNFDCYWFEECVTVWESGGREYLF